MTSTWSDSRDRTRHGRLRRDTRSSISTLAWLVLVLSLSSSVVAIEDDVGNALSNEGSSAGSDHVDTTRRDGSQNSWEDTTLVPDFRHDRNPFSKYAQVPAVGLLDSFKDSISTLKGKIFAATQETKERQRQSVGEALHLKMDSAGQNANEHGMEQLTGLDVMAIRRLSHRHAFLAQTSLPGAGPRTQHHRMAHACHHNDDDLFDDDGDGDSDSSSRFGIETEDCSEALYDFSYFYGDEYQERANDYVRAFAGMKLHVFQQQQSLQHDEQAQEMYSPDLPRVSSEASAEREDARFEYFAFDTAYKLMEPMHLELGIAPQHYWDYAYTPVYYYNQDYYSSRKEQPSGSTPSPRYSVSMQTRGVGPDHGRFAGRKQWLLGSHSEETCLELGGSVDLQGAIEAIPTCNAIQSDHSQHDDGHSWWKWWFSFTNPWWPYGNNANKQSEYTMSRTAFAGGSHGQVWRGRRVCTSRQRRTKTMNKRASVAEESDDCDEEKPLILKRLKVEQGYRLLEAGLREIYFGQWIQDLVHETERDSFTTYVDHFFRELPRPSFGSSRSSHSKELELWIVFEDAGPSLRSYMYAPVTSAGGFVMYQHSPLWAQLRMTSRDDSSARYRDDASDDEDMSRIEVLSTDDEKHHVNSSRKLQNNETESSQSIPKMGRHILRSVLQQVLSAAATLHEHGKVHRDIKPSNVMCVSDIPLDDLYSLKRLPNIQCRLGDFSSGWDHYTNNNLYTKGPSPAEQTDEYAPPESYIDPNWVPFDKRRPQSYDSWSIGVLALELLLGTPNVFSVDQRTTVLLTSKMKKEGASDDEVQRALYLAALSHFCIYNPHSNSKQEESSWPYRHGDPLYRTAMARDTCTLQDFHRALRARDPLGMGFDASTDLLLHLIWQLVSWDPMERITAAEALQHPFFLSPDGTRQSLDLIPGRHNALESQMLDPRLDFSVDDSVHEFICPKCGRTLTDWRSCNRHAIARRHAKFCTYDRTNLPTCINTHSMLPAHPTSGYCDLQGRRRTIEDFHSIHLHPDIQFYGIFDGHTGNVASKYAASTLFDRLLQHLPGLKHEGGQSELDWITFVQQNVTRAFQETHEGFLEALEFAPSMDQSGTTATALLVTDDAIIFSSLGDSRAVISSTGPDGQISAIQLTNDHVASDPHERAMVLERGGSVSSTSGRLDRVNGTLAITRSIGDAALASMLSRTPHVTAMRREEIQDVCGPMREGLPCFAVLASDGLWDVMSNQEAVDMVAEIVADYDSTDDVSWNNGGAFQEAAEVLAVDAYVRGSTDNIGVCVVAIVD